MLVLVGPHGALKTTILRIIQAVVDPSTFGVRLMPSKVDGVLAALRAPARFCAFDNQSGDAPKLAQSATELEAQWETFSEKAPIAVRFHCDTQLRCMELGFEGHPDYPHCQPVNGNKHANVQYIEFQQLLQILPQLLKDLSPRS